MQTAVMCLLFAILAAAGSMLYANRTARESERKWCNVVSTLDDVYQDQPPQTPAGRQMAEDIHRLRVDFGCPSRR